MNKISITLILQASRAFEESFLNIYSLKKYNKPYFEIKTKINQDIKNISFEYETIELKSIKMIMAMELLPKNHKNYIINSHEKDIEKIKLITKENIIEAIGKTKYLNLYQLYIENNDKIDYEFFDITIFLSVKEILKLADIKKIIEVKNNEFNKLKIDYDEEKDEFKKKTKSMKLKKYEKEFKFFRKKYY